MSRCPAGRSGWSGAATASRSGGIPSCWPTRCAGRPTRRQRHRAEAYAEALTSAFGLPRDQLLAAYEARATSRPPGPCRSPRPGGGSGWASPRWRTESGRLELLPGELSAGPAAAPRVAHRWRNRLSGRGQLPAAERGSRARPGAARHRGRAAPDSGPDGGGRASRATATSTCSCRRWSGRRRFVELVGVLDRVAGETDTAVVLEGYGPPPDPRLTELLVTPDPGVLEVNLHPAGSWRELAETTATVYRLADQLGLGTETFGLDGRHSRHRRRQPLDPGRRRSRPDRRCCVAPICW